MILKPGRRIYDKAELSGFAFYNKGNWQKSSEQFGQVARFYYNFSSFFFPLVQSSSVNQRTEQCDNYME